MSVEQIRANKQRALIQETIRAAFTETGKNGEMPLLHPYILAVQGLQKEIEFFAPFKDEKFQTFFDIAKVTYESAESTLIQAQNFILADNEVSSEAEAMQPLVEYHSNLLKIYRLLFTRKLEGSALIPPAPAQLQKQVDRTYEALGQLTKIVIQFIKPTNKSESLLRKPSSRYTKTTSKSKSESIEQPINNEERISPFITEGSKKGTVTIDGIIFSRYV